MNRQNLISVCLVVVTLSVGGCDNLLSHPAWHYHVTYMVENQTSHTLRCVNQLYPDLGDRVTKDLKHGEQDTCYWQFDAHPTIASEVAQISPQLSIIYNMTDTSVLKIDGGIGNAETIFRTKYNWEDAVTHYNEMLLYVDYKDDKPN